jgi:hypothetical protein
MERQTVVSPPRLTLETGGIPVSPRALLLPEAKPTREVLSGRAAVEEQLSAPLGYRRFTVTDNFGVLIKEVLIRSGSVRPGFISRLHQFLAEENPGPRLT